MALINLAQLVSAGKARVEYAFLGNPTTWQNDAWCIANGFPRLVAVGDALALTSEVVFSDPWAMFRGITTDGTIPVPTHVELLFSVVLNMPAYGGVVRIGDPNGAGAEKLLSSIAALVDEPLSGAARTGGAEEPLFTFEAGYHHGSMESFSIV